MRAEREIHCPLCDWKMVREAVRHLESNQAAAPAVAAALGMPTDALLAIHQHQGMQRDEWTLRRHLLDHGPEDWLPALMGARARIEVLEKAIEEEMDASSVLGEG